LGPDDLEIFERMKRDNPARFRVEGDGDWGMDPEGLVLTRWETRDFDPLELASSGLEHRSGMDVGWVDPSAIIDSLYDRENKVIYVFNEFYKSGCQLTELAEAIEKMNLKKNKLWVDAAEPRTIAFFKSQGINAVPCIKGKDSVKAGIMFLQDNLIVVHPKCKNFINELRNFSYIKSKQTGLYTEDTTHEFSHAIDACRYGYSDIYSSSKVKTLNKSALGL
jgi:phage terminase large subunit